MSHISLLCCSNLKPLSVLNPFVCVCFVCVCVSAGSYWPSDCGCLVCLCSAVVIWSLCSCQIDFSLQTVARELPWAPSRSALSSIRRCICSCIENKQAEMKIIFPSATSSSFYFLRHVLHFFPPPALKTNNLLSLMIPPRFIST